MRPSVLTGAAIWIALGAAVSAAGESPAGFLRQTLGRISSIHVCFHTEEIKDGHVWGQSKGDWWQQGERIRCRYLHTSFASLNRAGKPITRHERQFDLYSANGKPAAMSAFLLDHDGKEKGQIAGGGTFNLVWSAAGLIIHERPEITLLEGLLSDSWERSVRRTGASAMTQPCIEAVSREAGRPSFHVWLDAAHGHLPRKLVVYHYAGPFQEEKPYTEHEVLRFHLSDRRTGSCFPAEMAVRWYAAGKDVPPYIDRVYFDDVQINEPIGDDILEVPVSLRRAAGESAGIGAGSGPSYPWIWSGVGIAILIIISCRLYRSPRRSTA